MKGLYKSDPEIIREMGLSRERGIGVLAELDKERRDRRRFPQPDPLFEGKRFWPAVLQWLYDYNGVRTTVAPKPAEIPRNWEENLDAFKVPRKAGRSAMPRVAVAQAQERRMGGVLAPDRNARQERCANQGPPSLVVVHDDGAPKRG